MGLIVRTSARSGGDPLENPNLPLNDPDAWDDIFDGFSGKSDSGVRVTAKTALTISALWRGGGLVANVSGMVPLHVQQIGASEFDRTKAIAHSAWKLCRRTWVRNRISAFEGRRTLTFQAVMHGNGYALISRNPATNAPEELLPIKPGHCTPYVRNGRFGYIISVGGRIDEEHSELLRVDASDVLHIHGLGSDGLSGHSIIELGRQDFGRMLATRKHAAVFFKNAATPKVLLKTPNSLSDKAYARLLKSWNAMHQGVHNHHKTAILEEGTEASPLTITPAEAQLLDSEKFSLTIAANWLGLPVHKVGGEGRTAFASLAEENQSTLMEVFDPWLMKWETECWEKLLTEKEKAAESHEIEFKRQAMLRMNPAQRAAFYRSAVGAPFMLRNEARAAESMPSVDGFDEPITPTNLAGGTKGVGDVKKADPNPQQNSDDPASVGRIKERSDAAPADHRDPPAAEPVTLPAEHRDALCQLLSDTTRRMAKRLAIAAQRGRDPFTDDEIAIVRDALSPLEALTGNPPGYIADAIISTVRGLSEISDADATAQQVVASIRDIFLDEDSDDET